MKELKKEDLITMRESLKKLQGCIRRAEVHETPYYYVQFDHMIHNIAIYLYTGDTDSEALYTVLLRDWLNANHDIIGLSSCKLLQTNDPERNDETFLFLELLTEVEGYFLEDE